ncbi:hypothetical protein CP533_5669 [Ophiocordyceps camponoti-saundersi (nom. inval.)]|nr:hypothetical protein CP533_5669 [Ophiocordyceps camponoti-saundersi (nom. inval.)]
MASANAPAHRSLYGVRSTAPNQSQPHTPPRSPHVLSGSYGSPSAVRAEDDFVLIEIGSRFIRAGFAGDPSPKAVEFWGPEKQRRVGDLGAWQLQQQTAKDTWAADYEIWRFNLRDFDLDLFQHRLDRLLRDAFTRCLLIDSRPRRMGLVLDPAVPIPLLSAVLDTLFNNFQTPIVSLLSCPTMSAVAAGVRSALVVDMGWRETVVTSVYEYREVRTTRSIRGGRLLLDGLYDLLRSLLPAGEAEGKGKRLVSFDECEDIMCRIIWCRTCAAKSPRRQSAQLDTVEEQDESDNVEEQADSQMEIALRSTDPPTTLSFPFGKLADLCDDTFFNGSSLPDDNEFPIHLLIYNHLLQLPMDVRAVCMSRLMFTGGCSDILGIKGRIVDEVTSMVEAKGWVPVKGKGFEQARNKRSSQRWSDSTSLAAFENSGGGGGDEQETEEEDDPVEAKIWRNRPVTRPLQGQLRAIHSLGPWAGASLACHLKMVATATIDRDQWQQQGATGASRPSDVDSKAQQRQSGLLRTGGGGGGGGGSGGGGGGHHGNWTLGVWGVMLKLQVATKPRTGRSISRPSSAPKPILDMMHIRKNPKLYEDTCRERRYDSLANNANRIVELYQQLAKLRREGHSLRGRSKVLGRILAEPSATGFYDVNKMMKMMKKKRERDDDECEEKEEVEEEILTREQILSECRDIKTSLVTIEQGEATIESEIEHLALQIPNLHDEATPLNRKRIKQINYVLRPDPTKSLSHLEIGSRLGIIDFASAASASGWGWYYLIGRGAQLENALVQYAITTATERGYVQVSVPSLVYSHIASACGFRPRDHNEKQQFYSVDQSQEDVERGVPGRCLAGTSEIPLAAMKTDTTLAYEDLPIRHVAVSRCYRAEAGARGTNTKGLYRVHEFTKVELFAWLAPDWVTARFMLDEMIAIQLDILEKLGLNCRVVIMPASDLGASAAFKIDIEAYFPSRASRSRKEDDVDAWGEVTSASICTDYQTRRLGTRVRLPLDEKQLSWPYTINATALAVPRVLAALLEYGWDEASNTVIVPECLRPWMANRLIGRPNSPLSQM